MTESDEAVADLVAALRNPDPNWSVTYDISTIPPMDDEDRDWMNMAAIGWDE